jgi:hypothetical protein
MAAPQKPSRIDVPIIDDWTEYKRLVLSELERLNQAVEKLKDQCVEIQHNIQIETGTIRESFSDKINNLNKDHPTHNQMIAVQHDLDELDQKFSSYKKDQQKDSTIASKWGFWAAVISIIGSLIVSIISLIVALKP